MAKLLSQVTTWEIQMQDGDTMGLEFDNVHTYKLLDGKEAKIITWTRDGFYVHYTGDAGDAFVSPEQFEHWKKTADLQAEIDEAVKGA
jgi:hypothetical protein